MLDMEHILFTQPKSASAARDSLFEVCMGLYLISCVKVPLLRQNYVKYYLCQGQIVLFRPNFNEASLKDILQLLYTCRIHWVTGCLMLLYNGLYCNNRSNHQ